MSFHNDVNYLACTLVGEARGEPIESIVGVANVIKNRALGNTYQRICLAPNQFSCWNKNDPNEQFIREILNDLEIDNPINDIHLKQCIAVARNIDNFVDNTKGCKNYVTLARYQAAKTYNDPFDWILKLREIVRLGNHVFLKE